MKKNWYHIKCFLLGIATSFSLLAPLDIKYVIPRTMYDNDNFAMFILGLFFFWFYDKFLNKRKKNYAFQFLAILFSIFLIFGYSYDVVGSALLVNKHLGFIAISVIKFIAFYAMFTTFFSWCYEQLVTYRLKETSKHGKLGQLFLKHPFWFSFGVIIICYIPYLIAYYPTILCNDPINQIREVMGLHTRYLDSVIVMNPKVTITNFNPILHTLLVGGCFKLGTLMGNVNLGLFLYTMIQTTIMVSVFAYSISYMKKEGVSSKFLWITLLVFALVPVFPYYAVATNKDTIFSAFILLYCIQIYDVIRHEGTFKKYIFLFLTALFVILFRNNGFYTVILSLPFLLIAEKTKRKPLLIVLIGLIVLYVGYGKVLLPTLQISNTSIREVLSIPFQQTARVVKKHGDEIPEEEREVIDYLLKFDTLGERYDPELADDVKDKYNKYATTKDLMNYFQVWFKEFFRYPVDYIDATIHNVYGYFYPNTSKWYIYTTYHDTLEKEGFDYYWTSSKFTRKPLVIFGRYYPYIPVLGGLVNIGLVVWTYFFMVAILLVNKKTRYLPVLLPALSLILVCIASPANTYFRYAQPYVFSLPIVAFLLYGILTKEKKSYRKKA